MKKAILIFIVVALLSSCNF
ncbi:MAG: lipoprotein [Gallicola sp.]|nr:lipoprotein [Gallicola sp.]